MTLELLEKRRAQVFLGLCFQGDHQKLGILQLLKNNGGILNYFNLACSMTWFKNNLNCYFQLHSQGIILNPSNCGKPQKVAS